jgi:hypothetical protein
VTAPVLSRAHLEALVVALALLNPALADGVDYERLSPAAAALLDFVVDENTAARACLHLGAADEYQARLATRTDQLTLEELRFFPAATLVALVNTLPVLGAKRRRAA